MGCLGNSNIILQKNAIILSKQSLLTELIVDEGHEGTMHRNVRLALYYMRNKYWIIGDTCSTVKQQLRICV